jgi:hypothetical protein
MGTEEQEQNRRSLNSPPPFPPAFLGLPALNEREPVGPRIQTLESSPPRSLARGERRRRRRVVVEEEYWVSLFLWCSNGVEKWRRNVFGTKIANERSVCAPMWNCEALKNVVILMNPPTNFENS